MKIHAYVNSCPDCYDGTDRYNFFTEVTSYDKTTWKEVEEAIADEHRIILIPRPNSETSWVVKIVKVDIDRDIIYVKYDSTVS